MTMTKINTCTNVETADRKEYKTKRDTDGWSQKWTETALIVTRRL